MNNTVLLQMLISMFVMNLPTLIVSIVALILLFARRKPADPGSLWALLGFGLALALCFVVPLAQALVQNWVMSGENHAQRAWIFTTTSGLWSVLHAVVYVFLLMAITAGRPASQSVSPPLGDRS
jgi:hypothetical protein